MSWPHDYSRPYAPQLRTLPTLMIGLVLVVLFLVVMTLAVFTIHWMFF